MKKNAIFFFILALLGGFMGSLFWTSIHPKNATISETLDQQKLNSVSTPTPTPTLDFWEKVASKTSSSLVGIQTISGNRVIRQGAGIVVSSDGLVATTIDFWGSKESVYQVFYEDKILKGELVSVDSKNRLILLKTSVSNSNIAELIAGDYKSGQDILLVGKSINVSKSIVVSQRGIISQVNNNEIILDTIPNKYLHGFGVSNKDGYIKGITYVKNGYVYLIKTEIIETFFKAYLEKTLRQN